MSMDRRKERERGGRKEGRKNGGQKKGENWTEGRESNRQNKERKRDTTMQMLVVPQGPCANCLVPPMALLEMWASGRFLVQLVRVLT